MSHQSINRVASCLIILGPMALACTDSSADLPIVPPTSTGGTTTVAGGNTSTQPNTGGTPAANGGSPATGGNATGGSSPVTGGASTGGANATGGSSPATGGRSTGGASPTTGGKATGGTPNVGGTETGGASPATGGKASGGVATNTGGKATGGKATGGAPNSTGGVSAGGQAAGGAAGSSGDVVKSPGCGKAAPYTGQQTRNISVSGTNRSYIVRLPDNYDSNHAYRLILSIHCLNGTAAGVASGSTGTNYQFYGLLKLAANSTIFVAPQGINNSWPSGNVPFLKALITDLEDNLCIDTSRVFAEGFSMGGSMSYALACEIPDMIRGVAVHSGGPMSGCNKKNKPVAYFMTHGTKDSVCTYPGYGVPQIVDFASINGCQAMDIANTLKPTDTSGMTPVCADYQGCSAGFPARACIFVGDHTPSPGGEAKTWVPAETWKFITQF